MVIRVDLLDATERPCERRRPMGHIARRASIGVVAEIALLRPGVVGMAPRPVTRLRPGRRRPPLTKTAAEPLPAPLSLTDQIGCFAVVIALDAPLGLVVAVTKPSVVADALIARPISVVHRRQVVTRHRPIPLGAGPRPPVAWRRLMAVVAVPARLGAGPPDPQWRAVAEMAARPPFSAV